MTDEIVVVGRRDAFPAALKEVLHHEGGYANHPSDPGGRTMLGVTQRVWEKWTGRKATEADMRALTVEKVAPLYRAQYWDKLRCDGLPPGLALCTFDMGVNAGPVMAAKLLQRLVGVEDDGKVGAVTLAAVECCAKERGEAELVRQYQQLRRNYYRALRTFRVFGKGWLRRVDAVETAALRLAQ